jgi:hypothetical protein
MLGLCGELDVLFLSTSKAGQVLYDGGDIDNRIKTLFDSLTVPDDNQVPPEKLAVPPGEFNCLLEDDKLVRRVSIENDQLLTDQSDPKRVLAIIRVSVKLARAHLGNLGLVS